MITDTSSYVSILLHGAGQDAVLDSLRALAQAAFVSPTREGFTVVYPEDEDAAPWLASRLSRALECPAWHVEADDLALTWALFESGDWTDAYDSAPGLLSGEDAPPSGGDAVRLCGALGRPADAASDIAPILRAEPLDEDFGYLHGAERHEQVVDALGLPPQLDYALGFRALERGEAGSGATPVADLTLVRPPSPLSVRRYDLVSPLPGAADEDLLAWLYGDVSGTLGEPMGRSLGTPEAIRAAISGALPESDVARPAWLLTPGGDFALDFALGPDLGERDHVTVYVSASEPAGLRTALARLEALAAAAAGWRALHPEQGALRAW